MKHFFKYYYIFHVFLATSGVAFAQQGLEDTPYINFERFSIVKPAEEIGFIDSLKWGLMVLISAPAVDKVVPLYAYDVNQEDYSCEQQNKFYNNIPSLIVTQGVASKKVSDELSTTLNETELKQFEISGDWLELSRFNDLVVEFNELVENKLAKIDHSDELSDELKYTLSNLNNLSNTPELIWDEIRVSDACDLTDLFKHRQNDTITWKPVDNTRWPQLRGVSRRATKQISTPPYMLVAAEPVPKFPSVTQFYAECDSMTGDDQSLCAEQQF